MKKTNNILITLAFAFVLISIIIMSTVPPVSRDSQTHHLALPKIWMSQGVLSEVPDMEFSYYPQLIDLLYYLPVKLDIDIAAKYIHFAFALGTLFLIFLFIRRYIGTYWGLLGGLMFITVPIIVKLSVTVYVDLGLLFFFTASLLSAFIWLEDVKKIKWLIISGVSSGLTLSCKYNAILSVTLLTLLLGYFFIKTRVNKNKEQFNIVKYIAIFSFFALLIYSPWLIRNYSLTKNPVYPLYQSFFAQVNDKENQNEDVKKNAVSELKPLTYRRMVYQESLPETLTIPLRVFFEGQDDNPKYFDGKLNPYLLLFSIILLLLKKKHWRFQFLAAYVVFTLFYTLLAVDMRIRYVITIVSPMIILSVFGLYHLNQWIQQKTPTLLIKNVVLAILISLYFVYNISYGVKLYNKIDPIPYLTGEVSRDDYIKKELPYYSLNKLANKVVSSNAKLLAIYTGNRRYYIDVPLSLESTMLFSLANKVVDTSGFMQELSKKKITHILVRIDLFKNELSRRNEKIKWIITQFFSKHVKVLGTKDVFVLYEITP